GDHASPFCELAFQIVEVEARVLPDLDEADAQAVVTGELQPGRDVAVVVEARDEDLIARLERARERAREREVERRHVLAEDRLLGWAAEETGRRRVRKLDELVAAATGGERTAQIRVRLAEVRGDGVDHGLGALGPARRVEERDAWREYREACPCRCDVEGHPCSSGAIVSPCSRSCSQ